MNSAGAWAGQIPPVAIPTRPVKGQMLSLADVANGSLRHVVRAPDVYLIPRTGLNGDGRIVIGATVEEAGFDRGVDKESIHRLRTAAIELVPSLAHLPMVEAWSGLRPGTPDDLPILGETSLPGYFAATGHYRDGILLAPITARLMTQLILGGVPECDISAFSPLRFQHCASAAARQITPQKASKTYS